MSTLTRRDPRLRRPPFDVPAERGTPLDLLASVLIAAVVIVVVTLVLCTGTAARSDLSFPAGAQPAYAPAKTLPTQMHEVFRSPDSGHGAPLVTRGNLVTVESDRLVGRAAGTGDEVFSYSHPGTLCAAAFYSERLVSAWDGADGCSDVTALNPVSGAYEGTRQSEFPGTMTLAHTWDYALALAPERLEIWRSDQVRTVEYGQSLAPQESGQQPRSGCTLRSAALNQERFAVAERCPGDQSVRLTVSKVTPKDSRKPEEIFSTTSGADEMDVIAVLRDGVLVTRHLGDKWNVDLVSSASQTKTVATLPTAPAVEPSPDTVSPGANTVRWFDGTRTHSFDRDTGEERWNVEAVGPGIDLGYGVGAGDTAQPAPLSLIPTASGFVAVDTVSGKVAKEYPVELPDEAGVRGMAQVGDIVYARIGGEVHAFKSA